MDNQKIIKLAEQILIQDEVDVDGDTWIEYAGSSEQILKFAQEVFDLGVVYALSSDI